MQRVSVMKMSEQEIMDLLESHGIVKRSAEEAEAEGNFESFEDKEEL